MALVLERRVDFKKWNIEDFYGELQDANVTLNLCTKKRLVREK